MASCRKDDHQMLFSAESSHYQPVHRHLHYHPHPLQTDKEGYTSNKITSSLINALESHYLLFLGFVLNTEKRCFVSLPIYCIFHWCSSFCRAMYNGIGLTTPRGSGTNGYVQRNLSSLRVKRPRDERGGDRDEKDRERLESQLNRQPNADILEHQRKRQLEVKCAELQDMMEEQG